MAGAGEAVVGAEENRLSSEADPEFPSQRLFASLLGFIPFVIDNHNATHVPENKLINDLHHLADQAHQLRKFTQKVEFSKSQECERGQGLYLQTFIEATADIFNQYICELNLLLTEYPPDSRYCGQPSLTDICTQLRYYQTLFGRLISIIESIEEAVKPQTRGGRILGEVWKNYRASWAGERKAYHHLLCSCLKILFHHMSVWIVIGSNPDDFLGEFFIQKMQNQRDSEKDETLSQYIILENLVPPFLEGALCRKLLLIGIIAPLINRSQNIDCSEQLRLITEARKELFKTLDDINADHEFDFTQLQRLIQRRYIVNSKLLWAHVNNDDGCVLKALKNIEQFLLLQNGTVFNLFIKKTENSIIEAISEETASSNVQNTIIKCFDEVKLDEECRSISEKISLDFENGKSFWDKPILKISIDSPADLFFCDDHLVPPAGVVALPLLQPLFRFLLRLKFAYAQLNRAWERIQQANRNKEAKNRFWLIKASLLHADVNFLITNLQHYLETDVIKCQFSALIASIENASNTDFFQAQNAFSQFMQNLLLYSGASVAPVMDCFSQLFDHCLELRKCLEIEYSAPESMDREVHRLMLKFKRLSEFLMKLLTGISKSKPQKEPRYLEQLIIRLNF